MPVPHATERCWPAIGYRGPIRQADGLFLGSGSRSDVLEECLVCCRPTWRSTSARQNTARLRERARYRAERAISSGDRQRPRQETGPCVGEEAKLDARPHSSATAVRASRNDDVYAFYSARYTPRGWDNVTAIFRYFGWPVLTARLVFPDSGESSHRTLRWRGQSGANPSPKIGPFRAIPERK